MLSDRRGRAMKTDEQGSRIRQFAEMMRTIDENLGKPGTAYENCVEGCGWCITCGACSRHGVCRCRPVPSR